MDYKKYFKGESKWLETAARALTFLPFDYLDEAPPSIIIISTI